jgi:CSLREA domain-containing protein
MRGKQRFLTGLVGACLMMVSPAICLAHTTITVNSLADPSDSGKCTLRDAINLALSPPMSTGCVTSGTGTPFTIVFDASLAGGTILLGSALPTISSGTNLTITGPTTSSAGIAIDGGHSVRPLQVDDGATLTLQYLNLQNGSVVGASGGSAYGGGISNGGTLNISNSTLSGNQVTSGEFNASSTGPVIGYGGAIFNDDTGTLTVTDSTFLANQALGGDSQSSSPGEGGGGAIANFATATITNSTFSSNQAAGGQGTSGQADGGGGAIYNRDPATLTITNSTFSDNHAVGILSGGGAIYNLDIDATLTITNSTFSGNQAVGDYSGGGAIFNDDGTANLKGTILAESTPDNCEGSADPTDVGYNISDDGTCGFTATGSAISLNPMLDTTGLADNGGPTQTIALQAGSPAIDAIPVADCTDQASPPNAITTDQRGMPRPDAEEAVCDIGAYEFQEKFAGTSGATNCKGQSVSALSNQYGTLDAAASALGYPSVKALQTDITAYCAG